MTAHENSNVGHAVDRGRMTMNVATVRAMGKKSSLDRFASDVRVQGKKGTSRANDVRALANTAQQRPFAADVARDQAVFNQNAADVADKGLSPSLAENVVDQVGTATEFVPN